MFSWTGENLSFKTLSKSRYPLVNDITTPHNPKNIDRVLNSVSICITTQVEYITSLHPFV